MLPKKLASRITVLVMIILILSIIILVGGANLITKNFYQDHLAKEVQGRIVSHTHLLEKDANDIIIEYIDEIESEKNSYFMILDADLNPSFVSKSVPDLEKEHFLSWINEHQDKVGNINNPFIDRVDTSVNFHIPHVWALMPIFGNGEEKIIGYVFLDQDTGDLNHARVQLLFLLAFMGLITIIIGYVFTFYLTKKVSKPLNHISEMTKNIAEGDLDIELNVPGEDEVSHLAESIQSMTNQLKEYRDSRRHFISHISHDLRTPITYIKGYSAVMKESLTVEPEDWKRNLTVIYNEANRMEQLVSDLFLLTKLEEGKIKLEIETVAIATWFRNLYESRALMFDQKLIKHGLIIPENCKDLLVPMDSYRMEQAFINLLENAIRHTPKQGIIELTLMKKDREIVISVRDTGCGISEKDLPHIWERFYKADSSRNRNQSGTGLGLAIVTEIVEAHKGSVSVISNLEGTTFSIHLPL